MLKTDKMQVIQYRFYSISSFAFTASQITEKKIGLLPFSTIRHWPFLPARCLLVAFLPTQTLATTPLASRLLRNSRAYRAPRKDVIDYTRRSCAEILRVV